MFKNYIRNIRKLRALDVSSEESLSKNSKIIEGFQDYSLRGMSTLGNIEARPRYRAQCRLDGFLGGLLGVLKQGEDLVLFHSGLAGANNGVAERTGLFGEKFVEIHELLYELLDEYACLEHCEGTQFARGCLRQRDSCGAQSLLYYLNSNVVESLSIDDEFLNVELATTVSRMLERPDCAVKTLFLKSSSGDQVDQVELRKCRLIVIAALSKCVSITSLTVHRSNGKEVHELRKRLSANKVLENLHISVDGSLAANDAMVLFAMLKENHGLTSLTLESDRWEHLTRPLMAMNDGESLVTVSLKSGSPFGVPMLGIKKNRAHFSLEFMNLDSNVACEILDSMKNNKTLQVLNLQGCSGFGYCSKVASCLEAMLDENSTLEELKVDSGKWDEFYMEHLLRPLMAKKVGEPHVNISLKRLHILNYNRGKDWDLASSIARMLRTNTTLSHFSMIKACLSILDIYVIIDSLKSNKALQVLNLDECEGLDHVPMVKVALMAVFVNYNFTLSTIRMHGRDWSIEAFLKSKLEPDIKERNDFNSTACSLYQAIGTRQLEKGEGSTKVECGSSMTAFEKHKLEVEAKDERPRLFLSYSNEMKDFAMRLCTELKSLKYNVIDQDPLNVAEVVDQCQLAIVVLSNKYLNSEPSMLELHTIVKAKRTNNPTLRVYPLFYCLTLEDTRIIYSRPKYDSTGIFGGEGISLEQKEALKFLLDGKNEASKEANDLVNRLCQGKLDADKFCEQFNKVLRISWPSNGLEFEENVTSPKEYVFAILEEIFFYMPAMKECNNDQISGHQSHLEMESNIALRQMKSLFKSLFMFTSLFMMDFCLRRELNMVGNMAQHLHQKYIEYSSFQEMCPMNLSLDQQHEYSKGRIVAALFPATFLYHFKAQMLRGCHDDKVLPILKEVAELVAQKMQAKCNKNGVQTSMFFDFVDSGAPLDPSKKTIAMCQNFSTETSDDSKQLVIVQDDLSGAYYYQCDASDHGKPITDESIGVIGVEVTSSEIHVDNIREDGSSYFGVLGDFFYKFESHEDRQCAAKAFGGLGGASFLKEEITGIKCSPLLIIALASATSGTEKKRSNDKELKRNGLTLTWSNGKGHMELYPKLVLEGKVEVEARACQIAYNGIVNQLGEEIEWGTGKSLALHNRRGSNEILNQQGSDGDQNVATTSYKPVDTVGFGQASRNSDTIAAFSAATQAKCGYSANATFAGFGFGIGGEKYDSQAEEIMEIMSNKILQDNHETKGGYYINPNLDVEYPDLENHLLRCQLHADHEHNYLVVSNGQSTSHVSVFEAIEQNGDIEQNIQGPELIFITDIRIDDGKKGIDRIFKDGLKGLELTVHRDGSKFYQVEPLQNRFPIFPGCQELLSQLKSRFQSHCTITSSMKKISEVTEQHGKLKSKNEWKYIIGPQEEYGKSQEYWYSATTMNAVVYSRTLYTSGKSLKIRKELPRNDIRFCSIEDPEKEFEHKYPVVVSRGKFSRPPGSLLDNKVLWGGFEYEPIEPEEPVHMLVENSSTTTSSKAMDPGPSDVTKLHDDSKHRENLPQPPIIVDFSVDSPAKTSNVSYIVHNAYDLKQARNDFQLEKGEGSIGELCGSSEKAFEEHLEELVVEHPSKPEVISELKSLQDSRSQTFQFIDDVDFQAPLDIQHMRFPRETIALCQTFSTKIGVEGELQAENSIQYGIVQDHLTGAYYFECDKTPNLDEPNLDKPVGVIVVKVTSTKIHLEMMWEDGSCYSGELEDFSYDLEPNDNKQCALQAFGDLKGACFLNKTRGLKCSPLLVIALAMAIGKKGLALTWSNGKGHIQSNSILPLLQPKELEVWECQILYGGDINQLGEAVEWGMNPFGQHCTSSSMDNRCQVASKQEMDQNILDPHISGDTSNGTSNHTRDNEGLNVAVAQFAAGAQDTLKGSVGATTPLGGLQVAFEKPNSKGKVIKDQAYRMIQESYWKEEGGFVTVGKLNDEHRLLEERLCQGSLYAEPNPNYLVVCDNHTASHVSIYKVKEQNDVRRLELEWITDIFIKEGPERIKRIFKGLKGETLKVTRKGTQFLENPFQQQAKGFLKWFIKRHFNKDTYNGNTLQMVSTLEGQSHPIISNGEWVHIIGPQPYEPTEFWLKASYMQTITYSRTIYSTGFLLSTHTIEKDGLKCGSAKKKDRSDEGKYFHRVADVQSSGKFSKPPESLSPKWHDLFYWGGHKKA